VPLSPPKGATLEERQVVCWEWKGMARDEGEAAAAWFSKVLGKPTRLVRFVGAHLHALPACHAPAHHDVQACCCLIRAPSRAFCYLHVKHTDVSKTKLVNETGS
jgi:hypothetical protein